MHKRAGISPATVPESGLQHSHPSSSCDRRCALWTLLLSLMSETSPSGRSALSHWFQGCKVHFPSLFPHTASFILTWNRSPVTPQCRSCLDHHPPLPVPVTLNSFGMGGSGSGETFPHCHSSTMCYNDLSFLCFTVFPRSMTLMHPVFVEFPWTSCLAVHPTSCCGTRTSSLYPPLG